MVVSEACERSGGQPMEPRVCTEGKPPQQKHRAEVLVRRFEFSTRLRIWLTRSNSRPMRLRLYIGRRASLSTYRRSFDPHGDLDDERQDVEWDSGFPATQIANRGSHLRKTKERVLDPFLS